MEEKELFEDYEQKPWQWTPRLYKIFGSAVVIQFAIFAIIGQFNLLQTRACDNPLTGKVCEVLDALYVGSTFLGDKSWTDKDYVKNTFEEAEIKYVDMTSAEPPFTYPDGYFALVNPEELTTQPLPTYDTMGGFTTSSSMDSGSASKEDLISKKQQLPKLNPNPVKGKISDLYGYDDTPPKNTIAKQPTIKTPKTTVKPPPNDSPKKLPNLDGKEDVAKKTDGNTNTNTNANTDVKKDEQTAGTKSDDEILTFQPNKKPLEDLRESVKEKVAKNEVDLKAPFLVTIDGVLTKEGKLDPKQTRFTESQGDQKMVDLAKSAIEAINDSGLLTYLDKLGGKRIVATLQQDKDNITIVIKSAIESEEKAKTLASGFKLLISTGKILRKGKDEEALLKAATVTNQGKVFMLNFSVPQQTAQDLIQKQLKESADEKKTEPNSVATSKDSTKAGK